VRSALLLPLAVLVVAAGGYALCAAAGWRVHTVCVALFGADALLAGLLALVPLRLTHGASQAAAAQAALLGSVIHLLGCLVGAAVLFVVLHAGTPMVYWVLAYYLATLLALVVVFSRAIEAAPPATGAPKP
jgi:hypothetical protein